MSERCQGSIVVDGIAWTSEARVRMLARVVVAHDTVKESKSPALYLSLERCYSTC